MCSFIHHHAKHNSAALSPSIILHRDKCFILFIVEQLVKIYKMRFPIKKAMTWILPKISDFFSSLFAKKLYFFSGLVLAILLLIFPYVTSPYIQYITTICFIYVILASSYNLIMGYTGQLSFCHAAFYGVGAYFSALLTINTGASFWIALPLAGIACFLFAAGVGYPALKLRGAYFAVTTFFFGWLVYLVLMNWVDLTNGPLGLRGVPPPDPIWVIDFTSGITYYYFALVAFLLTTFFLHWLVNSNVGKIFISIREEETLAESLGINAMKYKVLSFAISAFFAGIAGSLFAHFLRFLHPASFAWVESDMVVIMTIVGGCGTILGPIIGAGIITFLLEFLRFIDPGLRIVIWAASFIVVVVFEPRGIMGVAKKLARILRS